MSDPLRDQIRAMTAVLAEPEAPGWQEQRRRIARFQLADVLDALKGIVVNLDDGTVEVGGVEEFDPVTVQRLSDGRIMATTDDGVTLVGSLDKMRDVSGVALVELYGDEMVEPTPEYIAAWTAEHGPDRFGPLEAVTS